MRRDPGLGAEPPGEFRLWRGALRQLPRRECLPDFPEVFGAPTVSLPCRYVSRIRILSARREHTVSRRRRRYPTLSPITTDKSFATIGERRLRGDCGCPNAT